MSTIATERTGPVEKTASSSLWKDTLRNVLRQRNARVGLVILGFLVVFAVFADQISGATPDKSLLATEKRLTPPCIHLLGCPAGSGASRWPAATCPESHRRSGRRTRRRRQGSRG